MIIFSKNLPFVVFILIAFTLNVQSQSCDCSDYVYLNDTGGPLNMVEKFKVDPITGALTEIGDSQNGQPWLLANGLVDQPHGIAADLNGFLYIGERDTNNDEYNIQKFTCDGEKVDADLSTPAIDNFTEDGYSYSHFAVGNYLYANIFFGEFNGFNEVRIYDLCTGDQVGCQSPASLWGLVAGTDGYWYGSGWTPVDPVSGAWGPGIVRGLIDPSTFTDGNGGCGNLESWVTADALGVPSGSQVQGVTQDNDGFVYATVSAGGGFAPPSYIIKVNPAGNIVATSLVDSAIETNDFDGRNWGGSRGIVWSEASNMLYVSSGDDCIAAFDTDLNYVMASSVNVTGSFPKQIGLLKECCPTPNDITIDTLLCNNAYPTEIFLQDLINCDGTICGGTWAEDAFNSGIDYNDCNNSIIIKGEEACGTFNLFSDGSNALSQCGQFTITINVESAEIASATLTGNQTICSGDVPTDLIATSPTPGVNYQWQMSKTDCENDFTDINGANMATYTPPALNETTYFRVLSSLSGNCSSASCKIASDCVIVETEDCCEPVFCIDFKVTIN